MTLVSILVAVGVAAVLAVITSVIFWRVNSRVNVIQRNLNKLENKLSAAGAEWLADIFADAVVGDAGSLYHKLAMFVEIEEFQKQASTEGKKPEHPASVKKSEEALQIPIRSKGCVNPRLPPVSEGRNLRSGNGRVVNGPGSPTLVEDLLSIITTQLDPIHQGGES